MQSSNLPTEGGGVSSEGSKTFGRLPSQNDGYRTFNVLTDRLAEGQHTPVAVGGQRPDDADNSASTEIETRRHEHPEFERARSTLREGVSYTPDDARRRQLISDASSVLCTLSDQLRNADAAAYFVEFLREMAAAAPGDADILNALGRASAALGALKESPNDLRDALAAYDGALNRADRGTDTAAFRRQVTLNKAIAKWQLASIEKNPDSGRLFDQAERDARQALDALSQEDAASTRLDRLRSEELVGAIRLDLGNLDDASDSLQKALAIANESGSTEADRARVLNNIGFVYDKKYAADPQLIWIDKALQAYEGACRNITVAAAPLEWCRTQRNRCDALRQKAEYFQSKIPILSEAIAGLMQARAICTDHLSPALRAQISVSLGDAIGFLSIENTDRFLLEVALYYYKSASPRIDASIIEYRINNITAWFKESPNFTPIMKSHEDIVSLIASIVAEHGVPFKEWDAISSRIGGILSGIPRDDAGSGLHAVSGASASEHQGERADQPTPGIHASRVLAGRSSSMPDEGQPSAGARSAPEEHVEGVVDRRPSDDGSTSHPRIPKDWDEAIKIVPGLLKWEEVKKMRPGIDILDHLRNRETGYGFWTRQESGLPLGFLEKFDKPAYNRLYNAHRAKDRRGYELPEDINISKAKPVTAPSADDLRFARRILRRHERQPQR
jgi:tetratricopeptide (TPR) repeat protein